MSAKISSAAIVAFRVFSFRSLFCLRKSNRYRFRRAFMTFTRAIVVIRNAWNNCIAEIYCDVAVLLAGCILISA
jgi:hypothetical protein